VLVFNAFATDPEVKNCADHAKISRIARDFSVRRVVSYAQSVRCVRIVGQ